MYIGKESYEYVFNLEKFVNTIDDWYPNYDGNKVKVSLIYSKSYEFVRISVWGNDDYGLELNFKGTSAENLIKFKEWKTNIYDQIPDPCTKHYFKCLNFTPA